MKLATNIKTLVSHNHAGSYVMVRQTADVISDDGVEAKDNMIVFHISQLKEILANIVDNGICLEEHTEEDHGLPKSGD